MFSWKLIATLTVIGFLAVLFFVYKDEQRDPLLADIEMRLSRLERVKMEFDARNLPQQKKELLQALVEAGQLIHEAYLYQYSPEGVKIRDSLLLLEDETSRKMLRLLMRNGGPYDKIDNFKNFCGDEPKPPGAGFYPPDLTKEELEGFLALHPLESATILSPYTVVKRVEGRLRGVPFHEEYAGFLIPAADLLKKASRLADNAHLKLFLQQRADALLTDDYYQSHLAWLDVTDSDIDLLLAPDEVYDDALMGLKASYEVSVMVKDSAESAKLLVFARYLDELEQNLPIETAYKRAKVKLTTPMEIVTDIYRGGDIATGYQSVAASLPNDPKVQTTKGTKKIFWKNMMVARVEKIILPVAREVIASDQVEYVTPQGVFSDVVLHEICHALGPRFVHGTNDAVTVNQALQEQYSALEEAKADIVGLHSMRFLIAKGVLPKDFAEISAVSALASMFRALRFGPGEAHGKASICELNYLQAAGGIRYDATTRKWSVVFPRFGGAVAEMARDLLMLEATGDRAGTEAFFKKWGSMSAEVTDALARLEHLPVDIEPVYSIVWN
jgi:hypothetical protein